MDRGRCPAPRKRKRKRRWGVTGGRARRIVQGVCEFILSALLQKLKVSIGRVVDQEKRQLLSAHSPQWGRGSPLWVQHAHGATFCSSPLVACWVSCAAPTPNAVSPAMPGYSAKRGSPPCIGDGACALHRSAPMERPIFERRQPATEARSTRGAGLRHAEREGVR